MKHTIMFLMLIAYVLTLAAMLMSHDMDRAMYAVASIPMGIAYLGTMVYTIIAE